MHGKVTDIVETEMFARVFSELPDIDKKEIMNLIYHGSNSPPLAAFRKKKLG